MIDPQRLQLERRERGMSQKDLAEKAGITPATVCRLERGHHRAMPRTLRRLAEAMDLKPQALLVRIPPYLGGDNGHLFQHKTRVGEKGGDQ